ncbi:MAG: TetR family transcriptional regulator [Lentisphaerae bacterium]|jgi:TetR/AcrR family acrAB operon transcriptional repressor|nr:TetR family transcriptional regulator [Lentisphaerota bacterium]
MARKTKDEAERTRERILASALALFVKNGYENTTLTDVAARLKMTKGAVYWHFSSKEKLLVAIVDEMLNRFASELEAKMPRHEMSFHSVADAMVENAKMIAKSPSAYLFMKTQVRWGSATMRGVREDLLTNRRFGPFNAFVQAIENDMRKGAIREGVVPKEAASICLAMWDGLVQAQLDKFLEPDFETVLRRGFESVWISIKKEQ